VRRTRLFVPALLAALIAAVPASAPGAADPLAVKGGRLVDGQGRAGVLHGVNVVYKLAPYAPEFTRADARRLRGWGMDAITTR
jgi:endoglycosylceramidase